MSAIRLDAPSRSIRLQIVELESRITPVFTAGSTAVGQIGELINSGHAIAADFNGDGAPDLAAAMYGLGKSLPTGGIRVYLNDGSGNFPTSTLVNTGGTGTSFLQAADMNGDGNLDLIASNGNSGGQGSVAVLLGNGAGNFTPALGSPVDAGGRQSSGVAVADFNGDGKPDVAVANIGYAAMGQFPTGNNITVLANNGNGELFPIQTFPGDLAIPTAVVADDFNGDGIADMAATLASATGYGQSNGILRVFLGNGGGGFSQLNLDTNGLLPVAVTTGDLNGDGNTDLLVTNTGLDVDENGGVPGDATAPPYQGNVQVFLGTGNGSFTTGTQVMQQTLPFTAIAGLLDGDGKQDIVSIDHNHSNGLVQGKLHVVLGNGSGQSFTPAPDSPFNADMIGPQSLALADFNQDGPQDVIVVGLLGTARLFLNQTTVGEAPQITSSAPPFGIVGREYSFPITATGNPDPTLGVEGLPPGLSFDPLSGRITGTPSEAGESTLVVSAVNGGGTDVKEYQLSIFPADQSPGTLQFAQDSFAVDEDSGTVTLTIDRVDGSAGEVTVDFTTVDGTAVANEDYIPRSNNIEFAPGEVSRPLVITILDDDQIEGVEETFTVTLSNPTGNAALGAPLVATITIRDNEVSRVVFQEGFAEYAGTQDAHLFEADPANNFNDPTLRLDQATNENYHSVTRFDGIIGSELGQIPANATILSASLVLEVSNSSPEPVNLHMLGVDFNEATVTWESIGDGLQEGTNVGPAIATIPMTSLGRVEVDVTTSLQAWVDGTQANQGWGFTPSGGNSVEWFSSEALDQNNRPLLEVVFIPGDPTPSTLQVSQLTPTTSGFVVAFNQPVDSTDLNLYEDGSIGAPDLVLTGPNGQEVAGSLIPDLAGQNFTFVATGGPLAAGDYTLTLVSADNAFVNSDGEQLDGDADGTPGGDYAQSFTVTDPAGVVIRLPDFARGPGQDVQVPNTAIGLPLTLSDATGVTSASLSIAYDPALLDITGATPSEGLPDGAQVSIDTSTSGVAVVTFSSPTALSGTDLSIINLTASVPSTASRGLSQVLSITGVSLNDGAIAGVGESAVHTAAFFGDVNNDGLISVADVTDALQVAAGQDTGFAGLALVDPRLVGDINGDGSLTVSDVLLTLQAAAGQVVPEIPLIP